MYKEVCFNRGTEAAGGVGGWGGGVNVGHTLSLPPPPSHFLPARGLDLKIEQNMAKG